LTQPQLVAPVVPDPSVLLQIQNEINKVKDEIRQNNNKLHEQILEFKVRS